MNSQTNTDTSMLIVSDKTRELHGYGSQVILLRGDYGSGRSSWLKRLAGIDAAAESQIITLNGEPPATSPHAIRMLFDQQPPIWLGQSVRDELCFGLRFQPDETSLIGHLKQWQLELSLDHPIQQLNRLQACRLTIAAATVAEPRLLLIDSITDALKPEDAQLIATEVAQWCAEHASIVVVAANRWHDWRQVASQQWFATSADQLPQPEDQS